MRTTCKRYFVDPDQLIEGVAVETLARHGEQELTPDYEALLDLHESGAKKNKEQAKKWIEAISNAHKKPKTNA